MEKRTCPRRSTSNPKGPPALAGIVRAAPVTPSRPTTKVSIVPAPLVDDQHPAAPVELDLGRQGGARAEGPHGAGDGLQSLPALQPEAGDGVRVGVHDVDEVLVDGDARGAGAPGRHGTAEQLELAGPPDGERRDGAVARVERQDDATVLGDDDRVARAESGAAALSAGGERPRRPERAVAAAPEDEDGVAAGGVGHGEDGAGVPVREGPAGAEGPGRP